MSSVRAQAVADVLWELRQAQKLATLTHVARRAGFSPGQNGKTIRNVLNLVRKDWPQLQWWRVVDDEGLLLDVEQQPAPLTALGIEIITAKKGNPAIHVDESLMMVWDVPPAAADRQPVSP